MICPLPECKQTVATKDGKHYGVHFQKITDVRPCPMSNKPLPESEKITMHQPEAPKKEEKKSVPHTDDTPKDLMFNPEVFHTANGTPYLKEPGVALIAMPRFLPENVSPFIKSYGDLFNAKEYVDDFYEEGFAEHPERDMQHYRKLSDAEELIKFAGQNCYLSFGEKRTKNDEAQKYLDHIKSSGHGSVMQHAQFVFIFWGIDRSCTHELVRHAIGTGFSQVSQRYVDGKALRFVERPEYQNNDRLHFEFEQWIDRSKAQYDMRADLLKDIGAHLENPTDRRKARNQAARACLPNEAEAPIVMSANVRAWRHIVEMRASRYADKPIQCLLYRTFCILEKVAPKLFNDYVVDSDKTVATEWKKV